MFSLWWALAAPASAGCAIDAPPDAPFTAAADAPRVQVILELWVGGGQAEWARALLDVLDARGLPAVLVVPSGPPNEALVPLLAAAKGTRHGVAIALQASEVPGDKAGVRLLKESIAPIAALAGPVRTVIAPVGGRTMEALLGTAGFRSLVNSGGPATAEPRMAGMFDGQPQINVVLPPGPYQDSCGSDPHVSPFTPAAADRAAAAIARAGRVQGTPVVRVALDGSGGRPEDAAVLARWIDQVIVPSKATVGTAEDVRQAVLKGFRSPIPAQDLPQDIGGRMVTLRQVQAAATEVGRPAALPRTLAQDLSLTESFQAFLLVAAGRTEGELVRLAGLRGPAMAAKSTLTAPVELPAADVRAAAKALATALPSEIPAAFPVGGRLLTAGEFLLALSAVVRGEDPVVVAPVADPDPNQRGLGWGLSTLP